MTRGKRRIGIFGGTFNPLHNGHINSLRTVAKVMRLDELRVIPAYQSPLGHWTQGPSPEQRLEMVRRGFAAEEDLAVEVDSREIQRQGISYTIDTLLGIQSEPGETKTVGEDAQYFLIIGADQFEKFDLWRRFEEILGLVDLVVTSRPGYEIPPSAEELPNGLRPMVKVWDKEGVSLITGRQIYFVELEDQDISATEIRRRLRMRDETVFELLPSAVYDYIQEENLYSPLTDRITDYQSFTLECAQNLVSRKALQVKAYDVRHLELPAEFNIVASGTSTRTTMALAEGLIREIKLRHGIYPENVEGMREGRWVVIDYGPLMIHLFFDYVRQEYRIEELWGGAESLTVAELPPSLVAQPE